MTCHTCGRVAAPDPTTGYDADTCCATCEPEGCADCGQAVCDCDTRCLGCMHKFTSKAEEAVGYCIECQMDAAESLRDEVA